nr:class I adenylate-forming enzyme family protein [Tardiphaga alba]
MPEFTALDALVRDTARRLPQKIAVIDPDRAVAYADFDALIDRIAASLQASGLKPQDTISICALSSIEYAATFLGALRAGIAVAPLAPSSTPADFAAMVKDAAAKILFMDNTTAESFASADIDPALPRVALDGGKAGMAFKDWLAPEGSMPTPVTIDPQWVFNIIYSSGTTGTPKGIVHTHHMRWRQYASSIRSATGRMRSRCCPRRFIPTRRWCASIRPLPAAARWY